MNIPNIQTPDLVFYHADCADGFGAAWSAKQLYPNAEYRSLHYGDTLDPSMTANLNVLMVDVALSPDIMDAIHQVAKSFQLLDHHKTAFEQLGDRPYAMIDQSRSGAGLAWDVLHQTPRPPLIDVVEDRDLWKWVLPDSRDITVVLDTLPMTDEAWTDFNKRLSTQEGREGIVQQGRSMRRYHEKIIVDMSKDAMPIVQQGRKGFACCVPHIFASDVGALLAKKEGSTFGLTWYMRKDGLVRASWRGTDTPVDMLAAEYGGGGHPFAAGAQVTLEQLTPLLDSLPKPPARPKCC